jgi:hypothetical protein
MLPEHHVKYIIIREFISQVKNGDGTSRTYEQSRELIRKETPELENYFYEELRDAVLKRLEMDCSAALREALLHAYRASLDDQRELGD